MGRIGLAKFLYKCRVPSVQTAQCRCRAGEETARHMALFYDKGSGISPALALPPILHPLCTEEAGRRQHLRIGGRLDYRQLIGTNNGARKLAEWIVRLGRIGQFSLARRLLYS
jgi:hypothetical protein